MNTQPKPLEAFLARVENYLASTGMAPARFGELAVNDPCFVSDVLREGREPRFSTIEKVEAFMREHPNGEPEKPAAVTGT
jgi:hypothetical protein